MEILMWISWSRNCFLLLCDLTNLVALVEQLNHFKNLGQWHYNGMETTCGVYTNRNYVLFLWYCQRSLVLLLQFPDTWSLLHMRTKRLYTSMYIWYGNHDRKFSKLLDLIVRMLMSSQKLMHLLISGVHGEDHSKSRGVYVPSFCKFYPMYSK